MAIATAAARQGNDVFDCNGAQIRAHCRHLATVVTIRGEIDAVNVDGASEYIRRFILANSPVVLDMSDVSHFAAAGIALLSTFDDECRAAGVEWTLVASPAVLDLLDQCGQDEALFPVSVLGPRGAARPGQRHCHPPPAGAAVDQEDGLARASALERSSLATPTTANTPAMIASSMVSSSSCGSYTNDVV